MLQLVEVKLIVNTVLYILFKTITMQSIFI